MTSCLSYTLILFAVAVTTTYTETLIPPTKWTYETFPNPQTQKELCGHDPETVKYVCDPNNLLSDQEAIQLEVLIEEFMNSTGCPCAEETCKKSSSPGYRIGVALMKGMNLSHLEGKSSAERLRESLSYSGVFANTLLDRWQLGRCEEALIILYAENNTVIYTATDEQTSKILTGDLAAEIQQSVQWYFSPSNDKSMGLQKLISKYREVFNNNYERMEQKVVKPKYDAVIGGSDRLVTFTLATLTLTLLAALI